MANDTSAPVMGSTEDLEQRAQQHFTEPAPQMEPSAPAPMMAPQLTNPNPWIGILQHTQNIHNPIARTAARIGGLAGAALSDTGAGVKMQEIQAAQNESQQKLMQSQQEHEQAMQHQQEEHEQNMAFQREMLATKNAAQSALETQKEGGQKTLETQKEGGAQALEAQKEAGRPTKLAPGKVVQRQMPDGTTHAWMVDAATGEDIRDLGPQGKETRTYGRMEPVNDAQGNVLGWADTTSGRFFPFSSTGKGEAEPPKPTAQSLAMGQMAQTVQPMVNNIKGEVESLKDSIGPAVGRWNELLVSKGGTDFPEFAGLDTDLDLLASAIVRTHFGSRGGQGYREALKKQFSAAQSPEDLLSRIDHADEWIKGYAKMAGTGAPATKGATPQDPLGIR